MDKDFDIQNKFPYYLRYKVEQTCFMNFYIVMNRLLFYTWFIVGLLIFSPFCTYGHGLKIVKTDTNQALLLYKGKPLIAFGASPQFILTELPNSSSNDFNDWLEWARKYAVKNVRSYPPSIMVSYPSINVFKRSASDPEKIDLNVFNQKYFDELREACRQLREEDIIVHLQFWQAIFWKKEWSNNYYNTKNNVNDDISLHAGPGEFVTMRNPVLLQHQKQYVRKILDATGDLGNVFYDIMNEIGNGTGTSEEWVWEIIGTVREWEKTNKIKVLLTLNDEGGAYMGEFSLKCKGLDLIVKDLGRYDEHVEAKNRYGKPTISVRNIDYNYTTNKRLYFAGNNNLEINKNENIQTRGRKYWWRMFMAGVQIAGGYSDAYLENQSVYSKVVDIFKKGNRGNRNRYKSSYRLNTLSEDQYYNFYKFTNLVTDYMNFHVSSGILKGHTVANSYCLQSNKQAIIYLESPNGEAGYTYKEGKAIIEGLLLQDGNHKGILYFPGGGNQKEFAIKVHQGTAEITLPLFHDDLAILIGFPNDSGL